ncbi:MAG: S41 family peptidase [Gemmatimonadales bacterium]
MGHPRKAVLGGTIAIALLGAAAAAASCPDAVGSGARDSLLPPEVVREDLTYLYRTLEAAHVDLFAHRPKADYDREYRRLLDAIDGPLSTDEVTRCFLRFVAFGNVAHAHLDFPFGAYSEYAKGGGTILPLELRVEAGRALVLHDYSGDPQLAPGTEVTSLDGQPIGWWAERLGAYLAADTPYLRSALMETHGFARLLWLDGRERASFRVGVRTGGGTTELTVPAIRASEMEAAARTRRAGRPEREVRSLEDGIAYLRPGPFFDTYDAVTRGEFDPRNFTAFVDSAFRQILASGATDLIIDLRGNPGGDNSFSDKMLAWIATEPFRFASRYTLKASATTRAWYREIASRDLPASDADAVRRLNAALAERRDGERFPFEVPLVPPREGPRYQGQVYALTDRFSFSMATSVAATIQDYRFGLVVGEETADLPTSYGSVARFTLPNTGLGVNYPKGYLVRPSGDERVRGVVPDLPIALPPGAPADDPGLAATVSLILGRRHR